MNQKGDTDCNKITVHFKGKFNPSKNEEHVVVFTMSWVAVLNELPHPYPESSTRIYSCTQF